MVARIALVAALFVAGVVAESTITAPPSAATAAEILRRQESAKPLTEYSFPYSAIPEQVNPFQSGRGPQSGYNRCNSTTEGPNSLCQTIVVNNASDWCLWGSDTTTPTGSIGDVEARVVGYCTQPGHGTRLFPAGSIHGIQFMRTSEYIQVVGFIDNSALNLNPTDGGGELDPHGADLAGNPLGGLVYSNSLPKSGQGNALVNSNSWNNFVGSQQFCMKVCDPATTQPNYCENRFDLIGCKYNMPASYDAINGTFTSCEGELQLPAGTYVEGGQTMTYQQPNDVLNSANAPTYTPSIPASSKCTTYSSAQLFGTGTSTSSSSTQTSMSSSGSGSNGNSSGRSSGSPVSTSSGAGPSQSGNTGGATQVVASGAAFALLGAVVLAL